MGRYLMADKTSRKFEILIHPKGRARKRDGALLVNFNSASPNSAMGEKALDDTPYLKNVSKTFEQPSIFKA